jgi:hypothetical protein
MIVIHCKNGVTLKYIGNVYLELDEPFLLIQAESVVPERDGLYTWSSQTYDKLWLIDIASIKGNDEPRPDYKISEISE